MKNLYYNPTGLLALTLLLSTTIKLNAQEIAYSPISANRLNDQSLSYENTNSYEKEKLSIKKDESSTTSTTSFSIGSQVWMKLNLDISTYRNGDVIPQVQDPKAWSNLLTGAWCYYENKTENGTVYGKLYNWYAVHDPRGLAPEGWHIPSDLEWTTLINFLGGEKEAGEKMKSQHSDFAGLLAGNRNDYKGTFMGLKTSGIWWSATPVYGAYAWYRGLYFDNPAVNRNYLNKTIGLSVRCVKD